MIDWPNLRPLWDALAFFVTHILYYTSLLGFIALAIISPLTGSFSATLWGLGVGLASGLIGGGLGAGILALWPGLLSRSSGYRRAIPVLMSLVTSLVGQWMLAGLGNIPLELPARHDLGFILSALVWAGLAAAFTTQHLVEPADVTLHELTQRATHPKQYAYPDVRVGEWAFLFVTRLEIYLVMGVAGALIFAQINHARGAYITARDGLHVYSTLEALTIGGYGSLIYAFTAAVLLGTVNGLALKCVHWLVTHRRFPDLSPSRYRQVAMAVCGAITTLLGALMMVGALAPQPDALLTNRPGFAVLATGLLAVAFGGFIAALIVHDRISQYYRSVEQRASVLARRVAKGRVRPRPRQSGTRGMAEAGEIERGTVSVDERATVNRAER